MHSPLLSGGKFVKEEKCTLVFGRKNAHVVKGQTGELVKEIMKQTKEKNSDDIVTTVPFDEKALTSKTDSTGQVKPLFNISSNFHQIRSKEILCNYLYQAADYSVKKTWLQVIKEGFFTSWPGLTYALVSKFLLETSEETAAGHLHRRQQCIRIIIVQYHCILIFFLQYNWESSCLVGGYCSIKFNNYFVVCN